MQNTKGKIKTITLIPVIYLHSETSLFTRISLYFFELVGVERAQKSYHNTNIQSRNRLLLLLLYIFNLIDFIYSTNIEEREKKLELNEYHIYLILLWL
jgi:hypothetical protein